MHSASETHAAQSPALCSLRMLQVRNALLHTYGVLSGAAPHAAYAVPVHATHEPNFAPAVTHTGVALRFTHEVSAAVHGTHA